jgi:hypothetical protein
MLRDEILSPGAELAIAAGVWMCRVPTSAASGPVTPKLVS